MSNTALKFRKRTSGEHIHYILHLRRKKHIEEWRVRIAEARAARIQRVQTALNAKRDYLDLYWKNIEQTNNLAKAVIHTLERNENIVKRAASNVGLTNDAVQVLVVNAEVASLESEDLVSSITNLLNDINCLPQPPDPNGPIMKAIIELSNAVTVAMNTALSVIEKTLETYQSTEGLKEQVGDEDGNSGLTKAFKELDKIINIKYDPDSKIKFAREGCPDDLWDRTKKKYDRVIERLNRLQERLNRIMERKSLATARKNAIETSLQAAESAAKC